jgi:CRISPR system Cascade subunit CasE
MELYLSRIELNPDSPDARRDLANPQELHRTLSRAFPAFEEQNDARSNERLTPRRRYNLLHRLEYDGRAGTTVLLVQSGVVPKWDAFANGYTKKIESKTLHDRYSAIENGIQMIFRLHANPSKRVARSDSSADARFLDNEKRRRVDIRDRQGRIAWLERKGRECGFEILRLDVKEPVPLPGSAARGSVKFRRDRDSDQITIGSVLFEGVLQVTDAERLRVALTCGVGPGKAYGFGLLSVAQISRV